MIKPFSKGTKRSAEDIEDEDESSPLIKKGTSQKKGNPSAVAFSKYPMSNEERKQYLTMLPTMSPNNAKFVEELLAAGCSKEEIMHSLSEAKAAQTPIMVTPLQSRSKDQVEFPQSTSQKQGIKLRFGKHKPGVLAGTSSLQGAEALVVQKTGNNVPENQPGVTQVSDSSEPISYNAVKSALRQVDMFCYQQVSGVQSAQGIQKNLEEKIVGLEEQIQKLQTEKTENNILEQKIKDLETEHFAEMKKLEDLSQQYQKKISQRDQMESTVSDWLQNMRELYSKELDNLAKANSEMMVNNQILLEQNAGLQKVKEKLKELQGEEDELNLDNVFIMSDSMEDIKKELMHTGNLIWSGIKNRIDNVLRIPWDAVAKKQHKDSIEYLENQLAKAEQEKAQLQEQLKKISATQANADRLPFERVGSVSADTRSFADIIADIGEKKARLSSREKSEDVIINLGSPIQMEQEPLQELHPVASNLNASEINTNVLVAEDSLQGSFLHTEKEPVKEVDNDAEDLLGDATNVEMEDAVQNNPDFTGPGHEQENLDAEREHMSPVKDDTNFSDNLFF